MKTAVFKERHIVQIEDRPKPVIGSDEVLVNIKACGLCGTDIHAILGGDFYPAGTVFGHECSGIVAEVSPGISDISVGDRVIVNPAPPCGTCHYCLQGRDNLCVQAFDRDIGSSPERPGACAEFIRIPWPEKMIYNLPEGLSFQQGAMVEPLAVAFHSVRKSRLLPGDTAVVLGAGPIGLGVIQFLRASGAGRIIVLEISEKRTDIARSLGADSVLNPIEIGSQCVETIRSLTNGLGADVVFECTGVPLVYEKASHYARSGGQVMTVGVIEQKTTVDPLDILTREIEVQGSMCYTSSEFQMTIDFIEREHIDIDHMISDSIPLSDLSKKDFLDRIRSKDIMKIVVQP